MNEIFELLKKLNPFHAIGIGIFLYRLKTYKKPEVFWCYFFNFFFYQIISTYYKRLQQTNWKWKYNIKYKHTTTYYWTLCLLKSNKAIKNTITIAKKIPWWVTICSNMGLYGCAAPLTLGGGPKKFRPK